MKAILLIMFSVLLAHAHAQQSAMRVGGIDMRYQSTGNYNIFIGRNIYSGTGSNNIVIGDFKNPALIANGGNYLYYDSAFGYFRTEKGIKLYKHLSKYTIGAQPVKRMVRLYDLIQKKYMEDIRAWQSKK